MASANASCNFHGDCSYSDEKLIYPEASRNKEPILQVLKSFVFAAGKDPTIFLEISSGSGQHAAHFAPSFTNITFRPSETDESLFPSINYYAKRCPTKNIQPPIYVDIRQRLIKFGFEENSIDYIYNSNMIHISPYVCTVGLFENSGRYLKKDGLLIMYGPYSKDGVITPESNVSLDASLKAQDPSWGLRDINDLVELAACNDISLTDAVDMPGNNKTLIWKRI